MKALRLVLALLGALATAFSPAFAEPEWPARPIRLFVPFAAGGGVDLMARITAQRLAEQIGQPVVVVNQGGGGGTIASATVAQSAPDGYTFIFHSVSSAVVNAVVFSGLNYDPVAGFAPVSLVARFPLVLVVHPAFPAKDMREMVALLEANPNKYSYGTGGVGTSVHLGMEMFTGSAKVQVQHVPYRGNSPATLDLLAGNVHMMLDGVPAQIGHINAGKVRAMAVSTSTRSAVLPDVPTMKESGFPDYDVPFWTGIFAPANTPRTIIDRMASETAHAMKHPATAQRLTELGAEGVGSTPEALDAFWRQQLQTYGKTVRDAGIRVELRK
ncbi:MAG: Bug family tripartite tricarboxylate transporter substrate binding protein [Lautropia sp.]